LGVLAVNCTTGLMSNAQKRGNRYEILSLDEMKDFDQMNDPNIPDPRDYDMNSPERCAIEGDMVRILEVTPISTDQKRAVAMRILGYRNQDIGQILGVSNKYAGTLADRGFPLFKKQLLDSGFLDR